MDQYTWFQSIVIFFYLYYYGPPPFIRQLTTKLYIKFSNLLNEIDKNLTASLDVLSEYDLTEEESKRREEEEEKERTKKYEDKYLEDIRKLNKELIFTEEEEQLREEKKLAFYNTTINKYTEEIREVDRKLNILNGKLEIINTLKDEDEEDHHNEEDEEDHHNEDEDHDEDEETWRRSYTKPCEKVEEENLALSCAEPFLKVEEDEYDTEYDTEFIGKTKDECIEYIDEEKNSLTEMKLRLLCIIETKEGLEKILNQSIEIANTFVLNKHLERLQNCFVLETTPHGNVLMIYDNSRGSFKYYSDNTIPYRYLEPVARKYVKQFNCRPLYVDMEEELKLAEEKWEKERKKKEEKEEEDKRRKEEAIKTQQPLEEKKNVFAKFKTYNKEAGSGRVNTGAPPKNSIPNNKLTKEQENEKILLKEKANRYTYEGKFANFSFLRKVERKIVDKKYGISFADFKKMCKNKN